MAFVVSGIFNAISFDVEDYFHVSAFEKVVSRHSWDQRESRVQANTFRLLDLLDDQAVTATFFVLGWVAERYPAIVNEIFARGHEVASHGYSHRLVYEQSMAQFQQETIRSKAILEDLIQSPVLGYRAASYSITARSLWALDVLVDAGFTYDSSIFPVRHDRYGLPDFPRLPHAVKTPSGASIIEFPLTTVRMGQFNMPIAGGGYFRLFPYVFSRWGLSQSNAKGDPFVFYLHPWEIDPLQPRINATYLSRFRHYNNLDSCEHKLKRLMKDFRFKTMRGVLEDIGLISHDTAPKKAMA